KTRCAMKKAAVPSIVVAVVLLALGVIAEAQQPKLIATSGALLPSNQQPQVISSRRLAKGCRSMAMWREELRLSDSLWRVQSRTNFRLVSGYRNVPGAGRARDPGRYSGRGNGPPGSAGF